LWTISVTMGRADVNSLARREAKAPASTYGLILARRVETEADS
jgi:hypothetical protein